MEVFDFIHARTPGEKMDVLEAFITMWYGPRAESYGDPPAVLEQLNLPMPLRRFYQFAGRWPARLPPEDCGMEFFYTGAGYHHLLPNVGRNPVKRTHDGFIEFYMEYQGEWDVLTKPSESSSEIWMRGDWDGCDPRLENEPCTTSKLPYQLVDFLVTHVLFTSLIEFSNNPITDAASAVLKSYFQANPGRATLIWESPETDFPIIYGQLFQLDHYVFAWKKKNQMYFGSNHPSGISRITRLLAEQNNESAE